MFRMVIWSLAVLGFAATVNLASPTAHANEGGMVNGHKCFLPGVDRRGKLNFALGGFGRSYKSQENGCTRYTCVAKVKNLSGRSFSETVRFRFGRKTIYGRLYISRGRWGYKAYARLTFKIGKCQKNGKNEENGKNDEE